MADWLTAEQWQAVHLSLRVSFWAMTVSLPFGIAAAYALARGRFWGRQVLNGLVHLPLILPPVVTGYLLLIGFGRRGPIGGFLDEHFGIVFAFRWTGAALASAVMAFPLMVRAIRLAIEAVDPRLEQAASTMGASRALVFLTVTLPLIMPGILAGAVLAFAKSMGEFGATITFVSNIPGETQTLPTAIYTWLQVPGGEATVWRLVLISIAVAMSALVLAEVISQRVARRNLGRMTLSVAIRHRLGSFTLDVGFDAPPGVTALFGRSGAGKTSLVNAVAGLLHPDQGRIALDDTLLFDSAAGISVPVHRRRLGYVFQEGRLFPHLSVRGNLLYGRRFSAGPHPALVDVVALLGIGGLLARRPRDLSGGEKQRVALGRALLSAPRMLLLDEPLAALDEARKAEILPYLESLRDRVGLPILLVSHSLPEVARLATTVVVLEAGSVLRAGPVAEVLADPAMAQVFGRRDTGAVIRARVAGPEADGLVRLDTGAGPIWLPRVAAPAGSWVRVRVPAQTVTLSRLRPEGLSALNVLPGVVAAIHAGPGPEALVQLRLGPDLLLAGVTQRSVAALGLAEGAACFAILKSVSIDGAASEPSAVTGTAGLV